MSSKLEVIISGDSKQLDAALNRATKQTSSFGKGLNVASVAAGGALLALGAAAKIGFDEFNQGQKVAAQTDAVIKSTGGSANVTAKQVDSLATSIMNYSGKDDEAVKSGANMLLTFTNIRNEAGKGNDVFNQSTKVLADMSTAMGTDMNKSAIQLGKALNDPVKGISALSKVGVTFTKGQKDSIKAMVDHGNVAGAQKVILAELTKEFGGSAKAAGDTFAGKMNIAKENASNFAGELVGDAMPALSGLSGILASATGFMSAHKDATKIAIGVVAGLSAAILVVKAATASWSAITGAASAIQSIFVTKTELATVATTGETVAQDGLNVAMRANPIGIVITAIALLATGLVIAWQHSETFRDIVKGAFSAVKSAADAVWGAIQTVVTWVGNLAGSGALKALGAVIAAPFLFAIASIRAVANAISHVIDLAGRALSAIRKVFSTGTNAAATTIIPGTVGGSSVRPAGGATAPQGTTPFGAAGAIVTRRTMALIGDAGPEALVPLSGTPGSRALGGLGGVTNVFNFPNYVGSRQDLEELMASILTRRGRRMPGALGGLA